MGYSPWGYKESDMTNEHFQPLRPHPEAAACGFPTQVGDGIARSGACRPGRGRGARATLGALRLACLG